MEKNKLFFRCLMLFYYRKGKNAAQTKKKICTMYGDSAVSDRVCQMWFKKFRNGDTTLEDGFRSGRPSTADDDQIKALIENNQRITAREIAEIMKISKSTVHEHLTKLGYVNRYDVGISHGLSDNNTVERMGNEKWIVYNNVERKRSWVKQNEYKNNTSMETSQCDLCLDNKKEMIVFERDSRDITIKKLFNGKIHVDDIKQICEKCDKSINNCYEFYDSVTKAIGTLGFPSQLCEVVIKNDVDTCSDTRDSDRELVYLNDENNDSLNEDVKNPLLTAEASNQYGNLKSTNNTYENLQGVVPTDNWITNSTRYLVYENSFVPATSPSLVSTENSNKQSENSFNLQQSIESNSSNTKKIVRQSAGVENKSNLDIQETSLNLTHQNLDQRTQLKTEIKNEQTSDDKMNSESSNTEVKPYVKRKRVIKSVVKKSVPNKPIRRRKRPIRGVKVEEKEKNERRNETETDLLRKDHIPAQISLNFDDFPKEIIKEEKYMVRGKELNKLLDRFYDLTCKLCTDEKDAIPEFDTLIELFNHYQLTHETKGFIKCCDKKLTKKTTIVIHMASHIQPSMFQCTYCEYFSSSPSNLKLHVQLHLPESERTLFECDQCDKKYVKLSRLQQHKMYHLPEEQRKVFQCKLCNETFKFNTGLSLHTSAVHKGRIFLCPDCGKSYVSKENYDRHLLSAHNPNAVDRVQCEVCSAILHRVSVKKHMKLHGERNFTCSLCDYRTFERGILNQHMKKHLNQKQYPCLICDKKFNFKATLKCHMDQHSGEKKYNCSFCPRTFVSRPNCYSHQKNMHKDELMKKKEQKQFKLLMQFNQGASTSSSEV